MSTSDRLQPLLQKLQRWIPLSEADQAAVLALPHKVHHLRPRDHIIRENETPTHCCLLLNGYAFRHKLVSSGARQILSVHMRGDLVDLHNSILRRSDHNIQALTASEVALIPVDAIRRVIAYFPDVGQAMWHDTLVDAAISREWMISVGRRDARARIAHLLCEFAVRLEVAGAGDPADYELPLTLDQLADAVALTNVHVSRMLKTLSESKLIEKDRRTVRILDFAQLARIGDFDSRYLRPGLAANS